MAEPDRAHPLTIQLALAPGAFYHKIRGQTRILTIALVFLVVVLAFGLLRLGENPQFTWLDYFVVLLLAAITVVLANAGVRRVRLPRRLTADVVGVTMWRAKDLQASSWVPVCHTDWRNATLLNYATGKYGRVVFAFVRVLRGSYYWGVILVNSTQYDVTVDTVLDTAQKLAVLARANNVRVAEGFTPWRNTA